MGLTKQYLRYAPAGTFNVIANPQCNVTFVTLENQEGRYIAVGGNEHVIVWDMRRGEKALILSGDNTLATYIRASPNKEDVAVGYADGVLKIYKLSSAEVSTTFSGHRNQITALAFDTAGYRIASGAKDNDVVIWDVVADTGVCRLSGHKGPITEVLFANEDNTLISTSKDTLIKFWDIEARFCFKTICHKTEVTGAALLGEYLVTGSFDSQLRVWKLSSKEGEEVKLDEFAPEDEGEVSVKFPLDCSYVDSIERIGRGRVMSLKHDVSGQLLACHGTDSKVELFLFTPEEIGKKRKKKKAEENTDFLLPVNLRKIVRRITPIQLEGKPRSVDLVMGHNNEIRVATVLVKNYATLHNIEIDGVDVKLLRQLKQDGHHSETRALDFSSDNLAIISGSAESIKVWNKPSQTCLRTIPINDYVLSLCFVPGDRHALAGMKSGKLFILDISVGDVLEIIDAHEKEIWGISRLPNLRGCVTGSGDTTVKFWEYQLIVDEQSESKAKTLSLLHTRSLQLEEGVLAVQIAPNSKFIAVSLLDSTVKIFFMDTLKFYLSLYGHKLPVLCMDISYDSELIATGSADRNIKIWGMDFGNCHKSIFAHNDSITGLLFIPNTHYLFSCGRDGKVKEWDADSFDKIITLPGHIGEAWTLAVSPDGKSVLSSGADYALRLWQRTDEPLVLEDVIDEELEQQEQLTTGEETIVPGKGEVTLATKKTVGSEKATELILECLEVSKNYQIELEELKQQNPSIDKLPIIPPIMMAFQVDNTQDYLLEILKRIRSSDMEEALLLLPFTNICQLLESLVELTKRGDETELIVRVLTLILHVHNNAIKATPSLMTILKAIHKYVFVAIQSYRDMIGYNLHSLLFLQHQMELTDGVQFFKEITNERKENSRKKKQRQERKRILMTLA